MQFHRLQCWPELSIDIDAKGAGREGAGGSRDGFDRPVLIKQGDFRGDGPIHKTSSTGNEFDFVQERFSRFKNRPVVLNVGISHGGGEEIVVRFTDDFPGMLEAQFFNQSLIDRDETKLGILHKVEKPFDLIEQAFTMISETVVDEEIVRFHGRWRNQDSGRDQDQSRGGGKGRFHGWISSFLPLSFVFRTGGFREVFGSANITKCKLVFTDLATRW